MAVLTENGIFPFLLIKKKWSGLRNYFTLNLNLNYQSKYLYYLFAETKHAKRLIIRFNKHLNVDINAQNVENGFIPYENGKILFLVL
jgi:hypothetical protein